MMQLRQIEAGNAKLKRIAADLSLDKAMLQVELSKALRHARKRKLVATVKPDWKVPVRRACAVLKIDRSRYV